MCAGCPGGRAVSPATAHLNRHGMKSAVLKRLQRSVGPRAALSVFGDRWVLASRTGRRELFDDVETLVGALVARGLVDGRVLPAGVPLEHLLEAAGDPGRPHPGADELVATLLADVGPPGRSPGRAVSPGCGRGVVVHCGVSEEERR
jgi:hypothetical protein